ncbi:hypothetical protein TNCV_2636161 [Trichonephila clavipes]|nr:hypothetical protein TNCV_2636161 [Trichonephila clavipes]
MQVAFQAEASFIDVRVGSAIFGGRDEVGMVHRVENHFLVFAILRNTGNEQFDKYTLATMVKQCSPFIYCWITLIDSYWRMLSNLESVSPDIYCLIDTLQP